MRLVPRLITSYGPGNYQLDLAMVRSFPLHLGESTKLDFRAEWYNVTNHTLFAVASTAVGNANFGQVTQTGNAQPQGCSVLGSHQFLSWLFTCNRSGGCRSNSAASFA